MFHGGGGVGFTSQVRVFPEAGIAIAVLVNRSISGLPDVVAERASELVLGEEIRTDLLDRAIEMSARIEALHEAPERSLRATTDPDAPPSLEITAYAGCCTNPAYGALEVQVRDASIGAVFHGIDHDAEHLHDDVRVLSSIDTGALEAAFTVSDGAAPTVTAPLGSPARDRVFTRVADGCPGG